MHWEFPRHCNCLKAHRLLPEVDVILAGEVLISEHLFPEIIYSESAHKLKRRRSK